MDVHFFKIIEMHKKYSSITVPENGFMEGSIVSFSVFKKAQNVLRYKIKEQRIQYIYYSYIYYVLNFHFLKIFDDYKIKFLNFCPICLLLYRLNIL